MKNKMFPGRDLIYYAGSLLVTIVPLLVIYYRLPKVNIAVVPDTTKDLVMEIEIITLTFWKRCILAVCAIICCAPRFVHKGQDDILINRWKSFGLFYGMLLLLVSFCAVSESAVSDYAINLTNNVPTSLPKGISYRLAAVSSENILYCVSLMNAAYAVHAHRIQQNKRLLSSAFFACTAVFFLTLPGRVMCIVLSVLLYAISEYFIEIPPVLIVALSRNEYIVLALCSISQTLTASSILSSEDKGPGGFRQKQQPCYSFLRIAMITVPILLLTMRGMNFYNETVKINIDLGTMGASGIEQQVSMEFMNENLMFFTAMSIYYYVVFLLFSYRSATTMAYFIPLVSTASVMYCAPLLEPMKLADNAIVWPNIILIILSIVALPLLLKAIVNRDT